MLVLADITVWEEQLRVFDLEERVSGKGSGAQLSTVLKRSGES